MKVSTKYSSLLDNWEKWGYEITGNLTINKKLISDSGDTDKQFESQALDSKSTIQFQRSVHKMKTLVNVSIVYM